MKFIDLFAGLGGFHVALSRLGHECVFASEINPELSELYQKNFYIRPQGDIRSVKLKDIPKHDILCAGFPCQPFSKAGEQRGLKCPQWGDLIDYVAKILRSHKPQFFIVENVPNLVRHNNGRTWTKIKNKLEDAGYNICDGILSPHTLGVPQIRDRAFIVGSRGSLENFVWPSPKKKVRLSIRNVLDKKPEEARKLPDSYLEYLSAWQEFLDLFPKKEELPSFPIWAMEFGATYPLEGKSPHARGYKRLGKYKGSFGKSLSGLSPDAVERTLPTYACGKLEVFPEWKIDFIKKNRKFYLRHRKMLDAWLPRIKMFPPSFQKFEWNSKGGKRNLWKYVIQFRASGIRVKKPVTAPSLVAMTVSQVPVITWEKRYMTPRECSRLQSMDALKYIPKSSGTAFKAFGNAVNVDVVEAIAKALLSTMRKTRLKKVSAGRGKQHGYGDEYKRAA
jgi:DNA (cytosine-5)-methyltransferase 1